MAILDIVLGNILFVIFSVFSISFWFHSATLDITSKDDYGEIGKNYADKIPDFDKKSFYSYLCAIIFILTHYSSLDKFCNDNSSYFKMTMLLNASAALSAMYAFSYQLLLKLDEIFPCFSILFTIINVFFFIKHWRRAKSVK